MEVQLLTDKRENETSQFCVTRIAEAHIQGHWRIPFLKGTYIVLLSVHLRLPAKQKICVHKMLENTDKFAISKIPSKRTWHVREASLWLKDCSHIKVPVTDASGQ